MKTSIKVYVGTYAKYNSGSIKGYWLDLSDFTDLNAFYKACKASHSDESDPEYMFQDIENGFSLISESWINPEIYEIIEEIEERDDDKDFIKAVLECLADRGYDSPALIDVEDIVNSCYGQHDSDEDFAYNYAEETCAIKDDISWPYSYIDWEHAARELMYNFSEHNGFYFQQKT